MRLLVTRPEPDAGRTAARLRALGHEVVVQPLLAIAFLPPPAGLQKPAAILITSQNGLRALSRWPDAEQWRGVTLFAAGPATARAAEELGFSDVRRGAGDAGSLADAVQRTLPKGVGPMLYPAARDRAGALASALTASGYDVRFVEAYRADAAPALDAPVLVALASGGIDGVMLYSRRTAETFRDLAVAAGIVGRLKDIVCYVLSEQVAEAVAETSSRVLVAARPDEEALLALIPPA